MKFSVGYQVHYFDKTAVEEYEDRFVISCGFPRYIVFKDEVNQDMLDMYNIEKRAKFDVEFVLDQRQNQERDTNEEIEKIFGFIPNTVYRT